MNDLWSFLRFVFVFLLGCHIGPFINELVLFILTLTGFVTVLILRHKRRERV